MAAIGNSPTQQAFTPAIDYFSGNGSTTAFTLSRPVASVAQVQVVIDNVAQNPSSAYTVSANTITFTSAPLSGTNNIYVYYTSPITQVIAPSQGTVQTAQLGNITNIASGNSSLTLQTGSGNTTAVTVDTSQNVGIGTTSPTGKLNIKNSTNTTLTIQGDTSAGSTFINFSADANNSTKAQISGAKNGGSGGDLIFSTANSSAAVTERARIDISGNLLVGTTTRSNDEKVTIYQSGNAVGLSIRSTGGPSLGNYESSDQSHATYWTFGRDNTSTGNFVFAYGGTLRGSINLSTGTYTASSDLRLKKNITNITYGLNEVMAMRPVTYLMNEEEDTAKKHLGFIAQEVKTLVDEAVDDLIDPDTQFYMLDKGGLVPVLVKAIQELKAINDTQAETINALTARIEALENR
jgi:hypothetical protein